MMRGRSMRFILICFFFVLHISIFFAGCLCIGSDTISTGQSLLPGQTIISRGRNFELGFFAPGNSSNFYVGIWYKNIAAQTVVWVANRDTPIRSFYNNSRLEMSNGTLQLLVNWKRIWILGTSNATEAVILDNGNFVLRNSLDFLWQSFDHPTDTWLPGASIGFRWFSDIEAKLVSWRNPSDPAAGNYSLRMVLRGGLGGGLVGGLGGEPSGLVLTNHKPEDPWRSGYWQEDFNSLSYDQNFYNFSYGNGNYSECFVYNVFDESVISRIVVDSVGRVIHFVWLESSQAWSIYWVQPSNFCKKYASCGPNAICDITASPACGCLTGFASRAKYDWDSSNFSGGCVRKKPTSCSDENGFLKMSNIRLPANPESLEVGRSNTCNYACRVNCSCFAYSFTNKGACLLFSGDLLDLERLPNNYTASDLYVRMDTVSSSQQSGKRDVLPLALGGGIGAVILVCSISLCYFLRKFKSRGSQGEHQNLLLLDLTLNGPANKKNSPGDKKNNNYELPIFSFSSIVMATNNFSIRNKLGEGGFGPVYKGELLNKQFVAVKRLSRRSGQGLEEFRNETELIAKLQHRNLVGILGCCIENDEKILVYEYMPNKSLDFFLFEPAKKELLDWTRRVQIIEGIAQGLLYLHHYSRLRIVHRDLKASNILLDAEMNPKISDFGMARIFGGNDSQANTNRIVGTYGYMSPEYAMEGIFSVKSDVFAFGILMLEIISGKKNTGNYGSDYLSLLGYAWNMWNHNRLLELIDPTLEVPSTLSAILLRYIQIGLLCVQENAADRPVISDIVAMLNNEQAALASPKHPAFICGRTLARACPGQSKLEIYSGNDVTVSVMEAR